MSAVTSEKKRRTRYFFPQSGTPDACVLGQYLPTRFLSTGTTIAVATPSPVQRFVSIADTLPSFP